MRFSFTGEFGYNGMDSKNPYIREGKTKSGVPYKTFNCSISSNKNNRAYLESFGMNNDVIKTMDTDGNKIEVSSSNRFEPSVINATASWKKNVVNVNNSRKEFISTYDAVEYLADNVEELKGKKITITGTTSSNVYNGTVSQRFTIQNVYEANEDVKNQLKVSDVVYFTKDSIDTAEWKENKKLIINGYINCYIDKDTGNKYVPHTMVLDASKIDFDNEKHVKLLKFKLGMIGCDYSEGKIVNKLKKGVYSMACVMNYINGAEEVSFDESMLTDKQREAVELGLKELKDFAPSGGVYGNRITEYKLVDFDLKTVNKVDYSEGYVDTDMSIDEFEEQLFVVAKQEKLEDIIPADDDEEDDESDSSDLDDLFD